jgi:hypothetical protein
MKATETTKEMAVARGLFHCVIISSKSTNDNMPRDTYAQEAVEHGMVVCPASVHILA